MLETVEVHSVRLCQLFAKVVSLTILLALMPACGNRSQKAFVMREPLPSVKRIAVLPFQNFANNVQAGSSMAEITRQVLEKRAGFQVMNVSEMQAIFEQAQFVMPEIIDRKTAMQLGKILKVDALVLGAIFEYDYLNEIREGVVVAREPVVGLRLRLFDHKLDATLWSAIHSRSSFGLLLSNRDSVAFVGEKAVDEMVSDLMSKMPAVVKK